MTGLYYKPIPEFNAEQLEKFNGKCEVQENGCTLWTGALSQDGYGQFAVWDKEKKRSICYKAHRVAYTIQHGAIAEGMSLDHVCRDRRCVNPEHLKPMPIGENIRLGGNSIKTHCPQGHPLEGENLYLTPKHGKRMCRVCQNARTAIGNAKRSAERKAKRAS